MIDNFPVSMIIVKMANKISWDFVEFWELR